jgi:hypothetical protein
MKTLHSGLKLAGLAVLVSTIWGTGAASAQTTQNLTINATVGSWAVLSLSPTTISFPNANPSTTPSIPANTTVAVTADVRTAGTPTLTVLANGDLVSGGNTIGINNVTWTASGAPFIAGTMNRTTAQSAATFAAGGGTYSGTYTYSLANSWAYVPSGTAYTQTATYTLTAP